MNETDLENLVLDYIAGEETVEVLCSRYGTSRSTLYRVLRSVGMTGKREGGWVATKANMERLRRKLLREGS